MNGAEQATQVLLALLRLGEQSAAIAFERLSRSATLRPSDPYRNLLARVAIDEQRHDNELARFTGPAIKLRLRGPARRFFIGLRDHDIRVHLARIAAVDGSVCQIITQILARGMRDASATALRKTLDGIRRDEGVHVRIARRAAIRYGASNELLRSVDQETRHLFGRVLCRHTGDFEALGVDAGDLLYRLDRATP